MTANSALIGFGFYMLHGCIQVQATEIAPDARGAAVSFHCFFFLGQAIGPVGYGQGLAHAGVAADTHPGRGHNGSGRAVLRGLSRRPTPLSVTPSPIYHRWRCRAPMPENGQRGLPWQ